MLEKITNWEDFGLMYHDYSFFGITNKQISSMYILNQKSKEPIITNYIEYAIEQCKKYKGLTTFTELFCADAYYAMKAIKLGAFKSYGVDKKDIYNISIEISQRLGYEDRYQFLCTDISEINSFEKTDIVANLGGLYHMSNPQEVLLNSYNLAKKYLIVQNVVTIATENEDYFVSPAPGWTWGCRYNKYSFDKMIKNFGWNILKQDFNELEGNRRLEDRGSVYYLIEK